MCSLVLSGFYGFYLVVVFCVLSSVFGVCVCLFGRLFFFLFVVMFFFVISLCFVFSFMGFCVCFVGWVCFFGFMWDVFFAGLVLGLCFVIFGWYVACCVGFFC